MGNGFMSEESARMMERLADLAIDYGLEVVGALALLIVGWVLAGWAQRSVRRALDRSDRIDGTLRPLIAGIVRYAILAMVVVAVLAQFGIQTASVLAVLGTVGLAVGLALQGTLSNVAAGAMLLILRPFRVGDYIDAEGTAGTVTQLGLFTTELATFDGVYVSVPNAHIFNRSIKNYTRLPTRRIDIQVGISYRDDIDKAFAVATALLEGDARVLQDPPPQVMVMKLADSSVNINLRCWTERTNYWDLLFDLTKGIKQRLDAEGITIPFPQRDVHLIQAGG
jgi:small conductance mechanosensitive channel